MKMRSIALAAALLALAACDSRRGMQVRTYELHRLTNQEAMALLTPYIDEGGYLSGTDRLLTVRTKPAMLDSIARILKRYDGAPQSVTLHFQVIEAGDFAGSDSAIARVAAPLREMLRYRGYRLLSEATVPALEGKPFAHQGRGLTIEGQVERVSLPPDGQVTLRVRAGTSDAHVEAAVSGAPGQTLVLGSGDRQGGTGALIVAVRPELGAMVAGGIPAPARP